MAAYIDLELAGATTWGSGVVVRPGRPLLLMVRAGPDYIAYPLTPAAARELALTLKAEADTAESDSPRKRRRR